MYRQDVEVIKSEQWPFGWRPAFSKIMLQAVVLGLVFYELLKNSFIFKPLRLAAVFCHETGHGIGAILTGGKVLSLTISSDEGGTCVTSGGNGELTIALGYITICIVGSLLLMASARKSSTLIVCAILGVCAFIICLQWTMDPPTIRYALVFLGICNCLAISCCVWWSVGSLCTRCIGSYWCLYTIFDVSEDCLFSSPGKAIGENDAIELGRICGISPTYIAVGWIVVSLFLTMAASLWSAKTHAPKILVTNE